MTRKTNAPMSYETASVLTDQFSVAMLKYSDGNYSYLSGALTAIIKNALLSDDPKASILSDLNHATRRLTRA